MRTHFIAIAALVGGSLTLNAQNPQPPQQQQQRPTDTRSGDTTQRAGQAGVNQAVTVTGCLKAENDVPGRRGNSGATATTGAAGTTGTAGTSSNRNNNRTGADSNYVLTSVKMAQSSATSGIGLATMYEIEGIADAELQKHLNHQVEITGTLSQGNAQGNRGDAAAPGSAAAANADLPQLNGTSLKMVSATCPAAQ